MPAPLVSIPVGYDREFTIALKGDDGQAAAWVAADVPTAQVWPGDDRAASFAPSCAWTTAPTVRLTVSRSDTADLAAGLYHLLVKVTRDSDSLQLPAYRGTIALTTAPGAGAAGATYCTLDDLRREAPWVDLLQSADDQSGFAEQRAEARREFDRVVQQHDRGDRSYRRQSSLDHLLDGAGGPLPYRDGRLNTTLQDWLDDDRLVVTGPVGEAIVRANALYALHRVCRRQLGKAPTGTSYQDLAAGFLAEYTALVSTLTVEVDTTTVADGVGDRTIRLGRPDTLRG